MNSTEMFACKLEFCLESRKMVEEDHTRKIEFLTIYVNDILDSVDSM